MVHIRSESDISKISKSCQIVADTLLMLEEYVQEGVKISKEALNWIFFSSAEHLHV